MPDGLDPVDGSPWNSLGPYLEDFAKKRKRHFRLGAGIFHDGCLGLRLRIQHQPFVVRLASLDWFHCFGFVFELTRGAFLSVEVTAEAQENRLEKATAFLEGVEGPNFHHGTDGWHGLVHRNGDMASRNPALLFMEKAYFHASFFIDSADHG